MLSPQQPKPTPINAHTIQSGALYESFDTASVTTMRATVPSHRSTARGARVHPTRDGRDHSKNAMCRAPIARSKQNGTRFWRRVAHVRQCSGMSPEALDSL